MSDSQQMRRPSHPTPASEKRQLTGPIAFIALIAIIESVLAVLAAGQVFPAAAALFALIASIQAATLLLLWYVFRLLLRVNARLKNLEKKQ